MVKYNPLSGGQEAVAQVEPERARLAGLHAECEITHIAQRPKRVFHLDIDREEVIVCGFDLECWQVDGNAIQAVFESVPCVGHEDVDESAASRTLNGRRRRPADPGTPRREREQCGAFIGSIATLDKVA